MQPNNRYGLVSLIVSILVMVFFHSMGKGKIQIEAIAGLMLLQRHTIIQATIYGTLVLALNLLIADFIVPWLFIRYIFLLPLL